MEIFDIPIVTHSFHISTHRSSCRISYSDILPTFIPQDKDIAGAELYLPGGAIMIVFSGLNLKLTVEYSLRLQVNLVCCLEGNANGHVIQVGRQTNSLTRQSVLYTR